MVSYPVLSAIKFRYFGKCIWVVAIYPLDDNNFIELFAHRRGGGGGGGLTNRLTELYYARIKVQASMPAGQPVLKTITIQPDGITSK